MSDQLPPGFVIQPPQEEPLPPGFELVQLAKKKGMDIFPQWVQDAAKYGPGFLKESGKDIGRGLLTGLAAMGEGASGVAGEGMRNGNITNSPKPQQEIAAAIPSDPARTPKESLFQKFNEGAGGALSMPGPGGILRQMLAGGASALGTEGGENLGKTFAPESPMIQKAMGLGGGMFTGALAGWTGGPKQSVAEQEIRRASKGADFPAAISNAEMAQRAGSTTATGAEMFPPGSSIMRLADKARAATPVNPLADATAGRPGDIKALADEFLTRISPSPVSPNRVANQTAEAATGAQTELKGVRNAAIDNALTGQILRPQQTLDIENSLKNLAGSTGIRPNVRDAYTEVASKLRDADGAPLTSVQQLSLAIKELKAAAKNPMIQTATGRTITGNDLNQAISAAEQFLRDKSPAFGHAMDDFKSFSQGPMADQTRGPIGTMAFTNPLREKQASPSKLDALMGENSHPTDVTGAMNILQNPVMTGGPTANATEIARALAQKKLFNGPTDPGQAVRGTEGSAAQGNFEALLRAGGNDARHTMEPLAVTDRLQPFLKPAGTADSPMIQALQYLIRPFRSIDMATTGSSMGKMNLEVAKLLADGSPAAIRKLQEISMFDPNVRRIMSGKAAAIPLVQGEE
jgi:hypothetical protein